ncbi:MAG: cysteine synthase A [Myxococcota bacterium]
MIFATDILKAIGATPVVKLNRIPTKSCAEVYCKLEMFNPTGSLKDRIALRMIEAAEAAGTLKSGMTIVEPTSGNTGISLAMVSAIKGYRIILVMPETVGEARKRMLKAFGANIIYTPGDGGMAGAIIKAKELLKENPNYYSPRQFENPANTLAHKESTAKEIIAQIDKKIDAFVAGVGTGGTIMGVGEELKKKFPEIRIIAVEPKSAPLTSNRRPLPHKIQGIGPGFIPDILNLSAIAETIRVEEEDAIRTMKLLARKEGILAGISSGAAVFAALKVARKLGNGKTVLTVLPDSGERYLLSDIWSDETQ